MARTQVAARLRTSDQIGAVEKIGRPDREKTKCISAHVPEDIYWQLKSMTVEKRTDMQTLVIEAVNELFKKYKKPFKVVEI